MVALIIVLLCLSSCQNLVYANGLTITSPFGWRVHPIDEEWKFHSGIDIALDEGTAIPAIWDGQVIYSDSYSGYGNTIFIDHGNGKYTMYAHCNQLLVGVGITVVQGQTIATVGSTGYSTGPHLHLSLIMDGQYQDPMQIWKGG